MSLLSPNSKLRRGKASPKTSKNSSLVAVLKQIQLNTATNIGQVNPDTVIFPILKRVRPYSVILSFQDFAVNNTTLPATYQKSIMLSQLSGYADYVSAFDKYRILEVQAECIPNTGGLSATSSSVIDTVIDYDDDSALTSGAQYEYDSCYSVNSTSSFKRTFIPRAALAAYSGTFTSYAEAKPSQWIDCASPNVNHYGLKMVMGASTPVFALIIIYRVHVQFANQH
jgi:hypothetical protein